MKSLTKKKFAFSKQSRLLKESQYKEVFDGQKRVFGSLWIAYYKQNNSNRARLGLVISKKISQLAVERNRFKRIAREQFRTHNSRNLPIDIVLIAKRTRELPMNKGLQKDFYNMLNRIDHKLNGTN